MSSGVGSGGGAAHTRNNAEIVSWDDLADVAHQIFAVWHESTRERDWARRAWGILEEAGLAGYTFEIDRTRVCLRFLSVGQLYHDWCSVAFDAGDDGFSESISEHADDLSIDPFYVGQLIGPNFIPEEDGSGAYNEALTELIRRERRTVVNALIAGFGGTAQLFVSLWRTRTASWNRDDSEEDTSDSTEAILNEGLTPEKTMAYDWIANHCPPR